MKHTCTYIKWGEICDSCFRAKGWEEREKVSVIFCNVGNCPNKTLHYVNEKITGNLARMYCQKHVNQMMGD